MKKSILILGSIILLLNACSVERRRYMKGFYVDRYFQKEIKNNIDTLVTPYNKEPIASISNNDIVLSQIANSSNNLFKDEECDVITLKTGEEISCKVSDIGLSEIKYKKCDNLNGPSISIRKEDVFMVKYSNGTKDIISKIEPKKEDQYVRSKKDIPIQKKTNGFAVASYAIVLSGAIITWFALFYIGIPAGILAIIFGIIGAVQIDRHPEKYKGKSLAILGIILGAILLFATIAFISIIMI